jgi:hypothetical protein
MYYDVQILLIILDLSRMKWSFPLASIVYVINVVKSYATVNKAKFHLNAPVAGKQIQQTSLPRKNYLMAGKKIMTNIQVLHNILLLLHHITLLYL